MLLQTIGYQDAVNTGIERNNASQQAVAGPQQELIQSEGENRLLRHRFTTQLDQASQIESSLAEVAQLTQVFTDQVMHQSEQIELLFNQVQLFHQPQLLMLYSTRHLFRAAGF